MSEYVRSTTFIPRTEEEKIQNFIESDNNSRLLCIHSNDKGGFGKTQLLLRTCAHYKKDASFFVRQLIDFYHPDMRRNIAVIESIAKQLELTQALNDIDTYRRSRLNRIVAHRQENISSQQEENIEGLFKKFSAEYHERVSGNKEKIFIFLFDSYEHLQRAIDKHAHLEEHSHWIETKLIPLLINEPNVRVILAGRRLPTELSIPFNKLEVNPFTEALSIDYLKHRDTLGARGGIAVEEMRRLHWLTDGHPIF